MKSAQEQPKALIVIFGATGDLARRKLFPSIYRLFRKGELSKDFAVIGVARRQWSNDFFRDHVSESVENVVETKDDEVSMEEFSRHFHYHPFDVQDSSSYKKLNTLLENLDKEFNVPGNRVFYMAMAPDFFGTIAHNLKAEGLTNTGGWTRLVIEKPFGHDFESAQSLNDQIRQTFDENEIYRIDHYLGKEMVQNIEVIRFANALFEPLWNSRYIDNIQVTLSETVGVGERARYYDKSGALRDMMQNHMMQMVTLLAMEPPSRLDPKDIRTEKVKVLRAMRQFTPAEVDRYFVRGQYGAGEIEGEDVKGYREDPNVDPESNTETYVAGKFYIDNFRWAGVPFYIRTGKRLAVKSSKIIVQFKDVPMDLYYSRNSGEKRRPNLLVINIQPDEGVSLHLNMKKSGPTDETNPVKLEYCNNCVDGLNTPEAYERLLLDCMKGDATNFSHWEEVATSWKLVDPISDAWEQKKANDFPNYKAGTMGPAAADKLLEQEGHHWWPITAGGETYK